MQVAAAPRRTQIGESRAGAASALRRGLEEPRAFLRGAVEIGIGWDAGLGRGDDKSFRQRIEMAPVGDRQRAAAAVIFVSTALLVLGLLEVRQHVVIAPAGIAALAPAIVILMLASDI